MFPHALKNYAPFSLTVVISLVYLMTQIYTRVNTFTAMHLLQTTACVIALFVCIKQGLNHIRILIIIWSLILYNSSLTLI